MKTSSIMTLRRSKFHKRPDHDDDDDDHKDDVDDDDGAQTFEKRFKLINPHFV